ncbi:MAG: V4R domain-containing protein [Promethearchaeota archaeon]
MLLDVFVIEKRTSILLLEHSFTREEFHLDGQLFSGLVSMISSFVESLKIGKFRYLDMGENRIQVLPYHDVVVAGIVESEKEGAFVQNALSKIAESFCNEYRDLLANWDNNVSVFRPFREKVERVACLEFAKSFIARRFPKQLIRTVRGFQRKFEPSATRLIGKFAGELRAESKKATKKLDRELHKELNLFSVNEVATRPGSSVLEISLPVCPVCRGIHDESFSCAFIEGFVEGFIGVFAGSSEVDVRETSCMARGDQTCDFVAKIP